MKNYTITVNGNVYDVTVEENGAGAPAAAPVAAPSSSSSTGSSGSSTESGSRRWKHPGKSWSSRKSIPGSYICWTEGRGWRYSYYH